MSKKYIPKTKVQNFTMSINDVMRRKDIENSLYEEFLWQLNNCPILRLSLSTDSSYFYFLTDEFPISAGIYYWNPAVGWSASFTYETEIRPYLYFNTTTRLANRGQIDEDITGYTAAQQMATLYKYYSDLNQVVHINYMTPFSGYAIWGSTPSTTNLDAVAKYYVQRRMSHVTKSYSVLQVPKEMIPVVDKSYSEQQWAELPNWSTQYNDNVGDFIPPLCTINNVLTTLLRVNKVPDAQVQNLNNWVVLDCVQMSGDQWFAIIDQLTNDIPFVGGIVDQILNSARKTLYPHYLFPKMRTFGRDYGNLNYNLGYSGVIYYDQAYNKFTSWNQGFNPLAPQQPIIIIDTLAKMDALALTPDYYDYFMPDGEYPNKDFQKWMGDMGEL